MEFLGLDELLLNALREDIGAGDITTLSCVPDGVSVSGTFTAKEGGVACGLFVAERVFALLEPKARFTAAVQEGSRIGAGDRVAKIKGPARGILSGERVALNLMQRMSGIATATSRAVSAVLGTKTAIVDTRKSTPGLRELEKYAVRMGGGKNHRFSLADGVLIKDNHIRAAGGIERAIEAACANAPHTLKIEVETESLDEVRQALEAGADIIMLDNMDTSMIRSAVELIGGRALTEASGNMGGRNLREVAECGVDFISIGALTHSPRALDISLKFDV